MEKGKKEVKKMEIFESEGKWCGISIKATRKGWLIREWSANQGDRTGVVTHVPYGGDFPKGCDLYRDWNEFMTYGDALYRAHCCWEQEPRRCLRAGWIVT